MKEKVLIVSNLSKSYNKGKTFAVNDINFEMSSGEIIGLVGKNGAGKSTIIKSITGVLPFDNGNISILDYDININGLEAKKNLGYVPDVSNAFDKMTGMEYLNFVADIFKVSKIEREEKINEFQQHFSLGESIHKLISSYSHGMKQKVSLMASLLPSPKLWILDEPTTGLDPQTTSSLLNYIQSYAKKGNAVLFSSHNLDIVQKICDRAIIINNGSLYADWDIDELEKKSKDFELQNLFMEHVK